MADEKFEIMVKWAETVIRIWEERIQRLGIIGSSPPQLLNSFQHTVNTHAGGNTALIIFTFNWYGRMLDMGVGRGTPLSESGTAESKFKVKPWYSKTFVVEVRKLAEFLASAYAIKGAVIIADEIGRDYSGV